MHGGSDFVGDIRKEGRFQFIAFFGFLLGVFQGFALVKIVFEKHTDILEFACRELQLPDGIAVFRFEDPGDEVKWLVNPFTRIYDINHQPYKESNYCNEQQGFGSPEIEIKVPAENDIRHGFIGGILQVNGYGNNAVIVGAVNLIRLLKIDVRAGDFAQLGLERLIP
jgi:hypothetical protein